MLSEHDPVDRSHEPTGPTRPGTILRQWLEKAGISQSELAQAMGVSRVRLNLILNNRAPVSPEMALRLAAVLGTSPDYWMRLQTDWSLFKRRGEIRKELEQLRPVRERARGSSS